jgi:putative ABC transport system substrate-binding protein
MTRQNIFVWLLTTILLTAAFSAEAQQPKNLPTIGLLIAGSAASEVSRIEAFRQGLRERGYVDGKNVAVEYRYAEGKLDSLSSLAAELVRLKVDVIVTAGPTATHAAKKATNVIPVVMAQVNDPVGDGFVANLARPGGNITGLSAMGPELSGKQLELLKEIIPRLSRVAVLGTSTQPGTTQALNETKLSSRALGVQLQFLDAKSYEEIEVAFRSVSKTHADALLVLSGPTFLLERHAIIELAAKNRLPAMYFAREFVEDGGLMTYAANVTELWRRAAAYVDKILKGAKPADLPVEQPRKFEFVINLKAAKQIGLTIPPNVLARADRVIK